MARVWPFLIYSEHLKINDLLRLCTRLQPALVPFSVILNQTTESLLVDCLQR